MPSNPYESSPSSLPPVFEMRKADLRPEVRTLADNLYAQIRGIYDKYEVKNAVELDQKMRAGEIDVSLKDAEKLKALMLRMRNVMRTGKDEELEKELAYYYPRELESVEKKKDYEIIGTLEGHEKTVTTLQVLPDGRLVSGDKSGAIIIWHRDDEENFQVSQTLEEDDDHKNWVTALQVLPNGRIVSGSSDKTIKIWDPDSQGRYQISQILEDDQGKQNWVTALQVLPNGRIVSGGHHETTGQKGFMVIWDNDDNGQYQVSQMLEEHIKDISIFQVIPDGRIVAGVGDGTIRIIERNKQGKYQTIQTLKSHEGWISDLQVLPDGRIVTGGHDELTDTGMVQIWDMDDQGKYQIFQTLEGHEDTVFSLQALPDGRIVSGSHDNKIIIWDKDKKGKYQISQTFAGKKGNLNTLLVLADGKIISGGYDSHTRQGYIEIWDGEKC